MAGKELKTFIGIDPAKNGFAWAMLENKTLVAVAWYDDIDAFVFGLSERQKIRWMTAEQAQTNVTIELPQIYRQSKWKGDPNDLIDVALTVGALRYAAEKIPGVEVELVHPHDWKGATPKNISHERILTKLTADECTLVNHSRWKKNRGDILDAVGIALFASEKEGNR